MPSTNTTANPAPKSQLEEFLHRANKANIRTEEAGSSKQEETWEVLDEDDAKKTAQDEQDKKEWVLVGKTQGDK